MATWVLITVFCSWLGWSFAFALVSQCQVAAKDGCGCLGFPFFFPTFPGQNWVARFKGHPIHPIPSSKIEKKWYIDVPDIYLFNHSTWFNFASKHIWGDLWVSSSAGGNGARIALNKSRSPRFEPKKARCFRLAVANDRWTNMEKRLIFCLLNWSSFKLDLSLKNLKNLGFPRFFSMFFFGVWNMICKLPPRSHHALDQHVSGALVCSGKAGETQLFPPRLGDPE